MKKLEKINNIILTSIILVLTILCINTTSNAKDYGSDISMSVDKIERGDTFKLSFTDYDNNVNKLLCLEHGERLDATDVPYVVENVITIEGDAATGLVNKKNDKGEVIGTETKTIEAEGDANGWNAKLAAAIHYTEGEKRREAIWYYMYNWVDNIGKKFVGIDKTLVGKNNEGAPDAATKKKIKGYVKKAKNADFASKEAYVEKQDTESSISSSLYMSGNKLYVKTGPFKLDFHPDLTEMKIKGYKFGTNSVEDVTGFKILQSGTIVDVKEIEAEVEFSILIPIEQKVWKISKIHVKTEKTSGMNYITAKIAFLRTTDTNNKDYEGFQNLCIVETSSDKGEPEDAEFDYPNVPIPTTGNVHVEKVDKDNTDIKLPSVGFKLRNKDLNLWVYQDGNGNTNYVDEAKATTFVTDQTGQKDIYGLLLGHYEFVETIQPNYGYACTNNNFEIIENKDAIVTWTVPNEQIYIKLSGYVWLDKISGKMSTRNDLYRDNDYDDGDTLVPGVTVNLKEGDTIVQTTTTNDNGAYGFKDVLIEKLGSYYMEFIYNGLTYQNVIPHIDRDNGSKAAENANTRVDFNQKFSVVENNVAKDSSGNVAHNLTYNVNDHVADLNGRNEMNKFTISANTNETGYSIKNQYDAFKAAGIVTETIPNINLGLYEREQPDIALIKDIENVRLTINGYEHTYKYAQRFINQGEYGDGFNVGVKFGNTYGKMRYSRAVYKSDYDWINENDKSKELQVYITYKIGVKNESTSLITQINNIVDYYDSTYEIIGVGEGLDEKGNITGNISNTATTYNSDYNKLLINTNTRINPQTVKDIYVQFKLSREKVADILHEKGVGDKADESKLLDNIAEINSYSIFDNNGSIYAGIDKDSNPGNAVPENESTYEDDTDRAPALQLEVANAREMLGKVFLDSTTNELQTGEIRQGSGEYEDGEKGIEGVNVVLKETSGTGLVYYIGNDVKEDNGNSNTNENGDFTISGFIPGDYQLVYTWGDKTYTVQNYKGTIYKEATRQNNKEWYKTETPRYSDAMDDYNNRKDIDQELKDVKYDLDTDITKNKMQSTTPLMGITVEDFPAGIETSTYGDELVYQINNIDFGIVERARQEIKIEKRVKTIKLILANGEVLANAEVKDGKLIGESNHLAYMGPSDGNQGFVKAELDNELVQGAKLEIGYEITIYNNSEKDYDSEDYYKYGIQTGDLIKIKPQGVYDYLDSTMVFDETKGNSVWETKTIETYNTEVTTPTILEKYLYDYYSSETDSEGNTIIKMGYELYQEQYNETSEAWGETINTARTKRLANKTILKNSELERELSPGEKNSVELNSSKILTTTDEIELNNDVEITEQDITTTTGRKITPNTSILYDRGETVIVTPPTGENKDNILAIVIGVMSLAILASGVILIKRKVLDNKE